MAFPEDPLPIKIDMLTDKRTWTDITKYAYARDQIRITRGQPNEATQAQPSSCQFTVNNRGGEFTPRNPLGPWYGQIGLTTPIRVSAGPSSTSYSTPSVRGVSTDIADEIGSTIELAMPAVFSGDGLYLFFHMLHDDIEEGAENLIPTGGPWTPIWTTYDPDMGGSGNYAYILRGWYKRATSEEPSTIEIAPADSGDDIFGFGVLMSIENGGFRGDFAEEVDLTSGTAISCPSRNPLSEGDLDVRIGVYGPSSETNAVTPPAGFTEQADLLSKEEFTDGIAMTVATRELANNDATGDQDFTVNDSVDHRRGISFTIPPASSGARFTGEMSSWPQRWDKTGTDVYAQLTASGVLRRLDRADDAVQTPYAQYIEQEVFDQPYRVRYHYYPLIDNPYSYNGFNPYRSYVGPYTGAGSQEFTFDGGFLSEEIPGGMVLRESVKVLGGGGGTLFSSESAVDFLFRTDSMGAFAAEYSLHDGVYDDSGSDVYQVWGLLLQFNVDGEQTIRVVQKGLSGESYDDITPGIGELLGQSGVLPQLQDGQLHHLRVHFIEDDPQYDWEIFIDGGSVLSGTTNLPSNDGDYSAPNGVPAYRYETTEVEGSPLTLGHAIGWAENSTFGLTIPPLEDVIDVMLSYPGETAGNRIIRIAQENDIPLEFIGDPDETLYMGPQPVANPLTVMRECVVVDGGVLYESRLSRSLVYRTLRSIMDPEIGGRAALIDYSGSQLGSTPESLNDDEGVTNDLVVNRQGGGNYRLRVTSGPFSTADPPGGIGRFPGSTQANVAGDKMLPAIAGWIINRSTVDEDRIPNLNVNLANQVYRSFSSLVEQVLSIDIANPVFISNPPEGWLDPGTIQQLMFGASEELWNYGWEITWNTVPASIYLDAREWVDPDNTTDVRYDSDTTTLVDAIDDVETSFLIDYQGLGAGEPWTTDDSHFTFDVEVDGERMRVSDIADSSGTQQTVTISSRGLNGVRKAHPAGSTMRLWVTPRYGR